MPSRVFLHVGSPKTGTTFLQAIMWKNREKLAQDGILLPGSSINDHFLGTLDLREIPARAADPARVPGAWARLVEEASGWLGDVLVSHEMLAPATAQQAKTGIDAFLALGREVHLVLTARDVARQLPAEWQERIKHRSVLDFPTFMAHADDPSTQLYERLWAAQDYVDIVGRWGDTLKPDQVHVVTVPASGAPKHVLWDRFSEVLGLDPDAYDIEVPRENASIRFEQAVLLGRINRSLGDRLPLPGSYTGIVKELFAHQVLEGRVGAKIVLGGEDLEFARWRSQRMVDGLDRLGVHVVGTVEDLLVPPETGASGGSTGRGHVPDDVLLDESIAATVGLLERVEERSQGWNDQRRSLRQDLRRARQRVEALSTENERVRSQLESTMSRRMRATAGRVKRRVLGVVGRAG